jgi:hypothetical protein
MADPNIKLAESLEILQKEQQNSGKAIKTDQISRTHRERLIKNKFLTKVTKEWYIINSPNQKDGDTTPWYTSFWEFCKSYLEDRYGENYCLSAEQSVLLHAGATTIPHQLIVRAPEAPNKTIKLLHGTSMYIMKSDIQNEIEIDYSTKLQIQSKEEALVNMSPVMFEQNPIEVKTIIADIKDPSNLLRILLKGSHSVKAGRLIAAFGNIGNKKIATEIQKTMEAADFKIRVIDPFKDEKPQLINLRAPSPYVNRINLMWESMRNNVIDNFPQAPKKPEVKTYLKMVDNIYTTDAYHSLSIENYIVSTELIQKVRSGEWNREDEEDKKHGDAMAARGYWQTFQEVKKSIQKLFNGDNPGEVFDIDHGEWYRQLFQPSVTAGLLNVADLAGYRNNQVYITNSMHTPLNRNAVRDAMPALIDLLKQEEEPSVRCVLGHFVFVYIHPYMDGNGRMGRFLMNLMLASGGYPWTVIPVERRDEYMQALEQASVHNNIVPFAELLGNLVKKNIEGKPEAKI